MKQVKSSRRTANRHRRTKIESLEPRQMLDASDVIISEIMYHPVEFGDDNEKDFEYVELFNRGDVPVALSGWSLVGDDAGSLFDFGVGTSIPARARRLVVGDADAVASRHGDDVRALILGEFNAGTDLGNRRETVDLTDGSNMLIASIEYEDRDAWPTRPDGIGSSLQIEDVDELFENDLYDVGNWAASQEVHGSPGAAGVFTDFDVVINEVLANGGPDTELDKIELHNTTQEAIDISGWALTDEDDISDLFEIPPNTQIPVEGYLVYDEDELGFTLSAGNGENLSLLLNSTPGVGNRFVDWVSFGATEESVSIGRLPSGSGRLFSQAEQSFGFDAASGNFLGAENTGHKLFDMVISEIHYNPVELEPDDLDPTTIELSGNSNLEFIELHNRSAVAVNLNPSDNDEIDWRLSIEFDNFNFPEDTTLAADLRLVVLRFDPTDSGDDDLKDDFESHYGVTLNAGVGSIKAVGGYGAKLSNASAMIELEQEIEADGDWLLRDLVIYRDSGAWPNRPDGEGSSLEREGSEFFGVDADSWRSSNEWNGSPGAAGQTKVDVIINEVLTHTDPPVTDTIELYNAGQEPVDVNGWLLSDDGGNYFQYRLASRVQGVPLPLLQPGEYILFDEDDFNVSLGVLPNDFALSSANGETLWLLATDGTDNPLRFADRVRFGAAANGESFGRIPNGDVTAVMFPNETTTLGDDNSGPRVGPLVISEIMYHPQLPAGSELDGDDLEFIEIVNPTGHDVDLTEWRLDGGVEFKFFDIDDDGDAPVIRAGEILVVVSFNPDKDDTTQLDAFREFYGIGVEVQLLGGYGGSLANGGERLQLQRPDEPPMDDLEFYPRLLEDEVIYDNGGDWPTSPDGQGDSLHRMAVDRWGRDVGSWQAGSPTPGQFSVTSTIIGDLTGDGAVDFGDLTILLANWNTDVSAAFGNLVSPATTLVDFQDLTLLLAHWTGPIGPAAPPAARAVTDSSPAVSAVFDEIGADSSSSDGGSLSSSVPRRARGRGASRREGSQQHRLQAVAVDRAMTQQGDEFSPLRSRSARRRGR